MTILTGMRAYINAAAEHTLRDRLIEKVDRSHYVEMVKQIADINEQTYPENVGY